MTSLSEADGVAVIAPDTIVAEGDWVEVMLLSTL
jgi:molybdopterin biosynthesis enzyme